MTLTSTVTSSTSVTPTTPCSNGGNLVENYCQCPSGYGGTYCDQKFGKIDFVSVILMIDIFFKILNYVSELFVKIEEFVLLEIQLDLLNLFVFVIMVPQVIIVN